MNNRTRAIRLLLSHILIVIMPAKSAIPSPTRTASTASSDISLQSAMSSESTQSSQRRAHAGKVVMESTLNGMMVRSFVKGARADTIAIARPPGNTTGIGLSSAQYGGGRRKMLDIINRLHNTG